MTDRAQYKDTAWTHALLPALSPLVGHHAASVCVVGAGIAGLTTAYLLLKEGRSVIVVDDGGIGGGESGLTTAHLTYALDRRWSRLVELHSEDHLKLAARSHAVAIDRIAQVVREEAIECDFRRVTGYLFKAEGDADATIRDEIEAAHKAGLGAVTGAERAPLSGVDTGLAARFPDQAQLHALRYLAGLARAVEAMGGRIHTLAHVVHVDDAHDDHLLVQTDRGATVRADDVVLATNVPIATGASLHRKEAAYRSYAIAMTVAKGAVYPCLYWDTADPLHYARVANVDGADGPDELLIVGGEDHKTGSASDTEERHARIEAWARTRFPEAGAVRHRWSGEVMETVDGLAYIGRIADRSRIFVVTGDCGNGMTHGTIAGMLITDLVHGRTNPWAAVYDPGRVNLRPAAAKEFVKDNLETAASYASWLTGGELGDVAELPPRAGAVMRRGLHKIAVYREPAGALHERSAVCPHMGALVTWNAAEHTWDCPAHGSRFACKGRVIHGPATTDLKRLESKPQTDRIDDDNPGA